MTKVVPIKYSQQGIEKYPDNAVYCPEGRLWHISLGIYPCRIRQLSTQYLSNKIELILLTLPKNVYASIDGRLIGKTPLTITDISSGFHNLQFASPGYRPSQMDINITKNTKETISIDLEELDAKRTPIESYLNRLWNSKWDKELETSIETYKIFWNKQFLRFVKSELGIKKLNLIANEIGMGKYPKYAHQDLLSEFIYYAIRKINNNNNLMNKLKHSIQSLDFEKQCKICGEKFRPIDTHEVFFDVCNSKIEYCKSCIAQCIWKDGEELNPNMTEMNREKMSFDLANLYNLTKIIPPAGFCSPGKYDFIKSFPAETRVEALLQLYVMRLYKDYVKVFGSWFKALVESGILTKGSLKTSRGVKCLALDEHVCFSLIEKQVDDWLYIHGIKHEKEPYYPLHTIYNPRNLLRADYLVNGIFIEIWGLIGDASYEEKIKLKRKIVKECKFPFIELEMKDFGNLDASLMKLMDV